MGATLRVAPCPDVHGGRMVKGANFRDLRGAGNPVELAVRYGMEGVDELTFLGISASAQGRETTREVVTRCAETVLIPLTVGGGVRSMANVDVLLRCGADKAGIDTGALADPKAIDKIAARFGSQVLMLSLDARRTDRAPLRFEVITHGRRRPVGRDVIEWTKGAVDRGVGEVLLNSMDTDSTIDSFDIGMIRMVRAVVDMPLTVSGGAETTVHPVEATHADADAASAAGVFHYGRLTIVGVEQELARAGFEV